MTYCSGGFSLDGVTVGVTVGVLVNVGVTVGVDVKVGVTVGVGVNVGVGVGLGQFDVVNSSFKQSVHVVYADEPIPHKS
jgi:hypothetical protein